MQSRRRSGDVVRRMPLTEKGLRMPTINRYLADAWLDRARRLRERGDVNQAVGACQRALSLKPDRPAPHRQLALNLQALGRYDEALRALKKVLIFRPQDESARHLRNALEHRSAERAPIGYVNRLFDRFADTFDRRMNGALNYRVPAVLGKRLRRVVGRDGCAKALDLGCGTGLMGHVLRPLARHLTGVDLSPKMLHRASRKRLYDSLECDDIVAFLERCDVTFDLITAADVFIYMGDLKPVFHLVRQRLNGSGIFAFSTERTASGLYRLRRSGRFAHAPDYIRRLAQKNHFGVLTTRHMGIRLEHDRWVNGDVFLMGRPSSGENIDRGLSRLRQRILPRRRTGGADY